MIALISGNVAVRRLDHVIVDCGGVGYRLAVSDQTLRQVPAVGKSVTLHTQLIVRDDTIALYGFASEDERDLFTLLLGVQSVGPKVALDVLSGGTVAELRSAIATGDAKRFQAVKGVGKRTAERIIVELREKVGAGAALLDGGSADADDPRRIARDGLVELGYSFEEAESLLAGIAGERAEDLIAGALRSTRR
jgi:Holliday junction DNA helicase RuvA